MKIHTRIAVLLLLCAGFAERAWPEVVVPIDSVASFVNVRLAPDAASEIVGRLQQGSQLRYVRTVDGWYEVELEGGGTGFVSVEWAKLLPDGEDHVAGASGVEAQPPAVSTDSDASREAVVDAETATEPAVEPLNQPRLDSANAAPGATAEQAAPGIDPALAEEPVAGAAPEAPVNDSPEPSAPPPEESPPLQPAIMKGAVDYLAKFSTPTGIGLSQVFDNGRNVGIGTSDPQQRLEVNGNIQIHERNSSVAGLMITQASGDTGYIMHNRGNTLTIGAGSVDRLTISADGNVGFGVNRPAHPIEMASGAHVSAGGVWTNSSSIDKKENVRELTPEEALRALVQLEPVRFNYKAERNEEYLGFIAEDVPELVATADGNGLSTMDIVAVLTSVVQQQQKKIAALEARLDLQMSRD